jgi:hypothetical protein
MNQITKLPELLCFPRLGCDQPSLKLYQGFFNPVNPKVFAPSEQAAIPDNPLPSAQP